MGLAPELWGPSFWSTIHLLCLGAPKDISDVIQLQYMAFFNALPYVIPCGTCSQHLLENYKKYPLENYLSSQDKLFQWSVLLHNEVNRSLNKPIWTEEEARAHWSKKINGFTNSSGESVSSNSYLKRISMVLLSLVAIGIVIVGIIYMIRLFKK